MVLKLTIAALISFTLASCEDDVRIKVVGGKQAASEEFRIDSPANLVTREVYTLTWSLDPAAKSYDVHVAKDALCSDVLVKREALTENKLELDFLADGHYYLCVFANTKAERFAAANNGTLLTIDTTQPSVTIPADTQVFSQSFDPDLKIDDLSKVTVSWSQMAGDGLITFENKNSQWPKLKADVDGLYKIKATITDEAGNVVEQIFPFSWDQIGPSVVLAAPKLTAVPAAFVVSVDSTAKSFEWTYTGPAGGILSFSDAAAKSPTIAANIEGTYQVTLTAKDSSGNIGSDTKAFVWDKTPPIFTSQALAGPASDGFLNSQDRILTATLLGSLIADGYTQLAYAVVSGGVSCNAALSYGLTAPKANSSDFGVDGPYKVCMQLVDAAGNTSYGASSLFTLDTAPALFTSIDLAGDAIDGFINLSEHALSHELVSGLTANDAFIAEYALVLDGTACSGPLTYSTTIPKGNDTRFVASGNYRVCVRVRDEALNPFAYGQSSPIAFTAAAPTFFSLAKSGVGSDGYVNDSEKAGVTALWTLNQSGGTLIAYTAPLDDTGGAVTCNASQSYTRANIATAAEILSDGLWVICVKLQDGAGNQTFGKSETLTRDVTLPVFTSLAATGLASDGLILATETADTGAIWTLTASGQSATQYTSVLDDTAGALVCDASKTYNQSSIPIISSLTTDGSWALCVRLSDAAGNVVYGKSSSLLRDGVPPVFTSLLGANQASDGVVRNPESASTAALFTLIASGSSSIAYTLALDDTPAVSCDASQVYDQGSIPLINSLGADDSYAVCVKLLDTAGNVVYGKSQTIVKDSGAPVFTSLARASEASDGFVNDSEKSALNPLWTLSEIGSVTTSYTVPLDDTGGAVVCNGAKTYSQSFIARAADLSSDGLWVICVKLDDGVGLVTYGKSQQITRDSAAPAFTALARANAAADGSINDSEKLLASALFSLSASGQLSTDYTLALDDTGSALSCNASQTYNQAVIPQAASLASDGLFALCAKLTDAAGNIAYGKSAQVIRDTQAPSFTSLNRANAAADGYIKSGEEGSNLAIYALSATGHSSALYTVGLDDSTPVSCDGGKTYSQSAIPLISSLASDGLYAVCAQLSDAAGNTSYGKSQTVTRDIIAPSLSSLNGANEASDGFINSGEAASSLPAWSLSATGQTAVSYTLALDDTGGSLVCNAGQTYGQSAIPVISAIASDGPWAICVRLTDDAGNISYGKSEQLIRDSAAPSFTSLLGSNEASDGFVNDAEKASTSDLLVLSASAYVVASYTAALDDTPAVTCDQTQTYNQASVPTIAALASDESWAVCVKLTDASGNVSYGKSQSIVRDTQAPAFTSLLKAAEGSDAYINDSEKNASTALWTLSATGASATAYSLALDDTGGALACNAGVTYGQGTSVAGATGLASDGAWSICVRLSDAAGNITYGKGESIVRDTAAPSFTSLARANAASDGYINDAEKALTSALWTLTASGQSATAYSLALDDTGGAQVCDSGDAYGQGSIAQPADLATDGAYALCVRLSDAAGNITYGKSAQVTRDIIAPSFTSLNGANEASDLAISNGEQNSVLALFTLSATGHTASSYTVALDDTAGALACNVSRTYSQGSVPTVVSIGLDGTYAVCVRLSDAAGNITYGKSQQITRNVGGPSFTSLLASGGASDGFVNDSEKASTAAAWTLSAAAYTGATYTLPLDDTGGAVSCDGSQTYGQGSIAQIDGLSSDGAWVICVRLIDGLANVTYGKSQQIIRDISAPSFSSLNGANEASDTFVNASEAASTAALLTLTASAYDTVMYTSPLDDSGAAVTCNAGQTYDQASIAQISALSSDLPYALCVKLSDNAGNITYGKSQQIVRDIVAPTFTSLNRTAEGSDSYINDSEKSASNALWTLSASGATVTAYSTALDDTAGALVCNSGKTYGQGTTVATAASISTDGAWSLCVKLSDAAGNITYGKGQPITRDATLPVFTSLALANAASDGYINDSEKLLVSALWTLSASGQSLTEYTLALDDTAGAAACNGSQTYNQSSIATPASLSSDQAYALCVRLSDAAGNVTYGKSAQLLRDVTAPAFTSLNGANGASDLFLKNGEEASAAALFALSASGHISDDFTVALSDDPVAVVCDSGKTYNQASIPLINSLTVDGKFAVCVKLLDAAGNASYGKSQQVERDIVAPTFTSLLGSGGASDGYVNDSEKASTAAAWALIASGQTATDYSLPIDDGTPITCDSGKTYGQASIAQIDGITSDGTWALCVRLTDAAGNITYGKSQSLIRDIVLPTFTSLNGANGASDLYINNAESASTSALYVLNASDYSAVGYTLALDDTPAINCDNTQTYGQGSIAQINSLGSDESYALCVRLTDAAGNISYGKSQTVVKDTAAPSFSSLVKAAQGSDGYINDAEKAQTTPIWTLTASGQAATAYTVALSDTGGSQVCDASDTYDQGTSVPGASGLGSDGAWTLCVKLTDSAGNISYGKGEQITRDIVFPVFTSLTVLNAASDTYINDSEKLLTNAMWLLSASGQSATDYTAALSDTGGAQVCDGSDTYNQASIAIPSSLSSDGAYALCVRLTDAAGNNTYGKSDQITRDIVPPVFGSLPGANEASDGYIKSGEESAANPLYAIAGSSGYTINDFTAALDDSGGISCNSGKTYSNGSIPLINTVMPDGTYAVCARLADEAGNITYGKSAQVIRDIVAPVFTSLSAASVAADGYIAYGERNSATAAWTLSASGQTSTDYTVALDDTGAAVVCDSGKTYGSGSIPLISSITTDGPWAACVRLTDAAGNITYGKSQQIIRDIVAPGTPSAFTATAGNAYIDLKWTASTGTPAGYVLVRGPAGSAPTFVPTDGTTYSLGAQGSDQIISIGAATLMMDSPLNIDTSYSYKVYAYDTARSYSAGASASAMPITPCASNYVFVAGDPDYGTKDFCVMKYEAKDVGGFATSQASSTPWVSISQQNSVTKCAANGMAYHLINNNEWMTIGSQAAALNDNWTGGTVGNGYLFAGHNDSSPNSACAASSNDVLFYVETNCTPVSSGDTTEQRRTFNLSNSSVIWDLSGNVWEWVNYINIGDKPGATNGYYEYTAATSTISTALKELVPTNAVKAFWSDAWNSGKRIGLFYPGTNGSGGALMRGGHWSDDSTAGVFFAALHYNTSGTYADVGLRCVQKLPDLDAPTLILTASNSQITANWTTVGGATGYILVRGVAGSRPTFQPINGTTYSAGSQGADQIAYAGTALTYSDTSLDNNHEYNYALYSYTAGPVYSGPARSKDTPLACPTGFVLVPGDTDYGTDDFCVMKYEAKNIGGIAASKPENAPWDTISQQAASTACNAMGLGYHLISNSEYMSVASQVASLSSNWSGGVVGTGYLSRGHADQDPNYSCPASSDDSEAYVENTCALLAAGQGEDAEALYKRTFNLANGGVIWDLAGNVWDLVNYVNISDRPTPAGSWTEFTAVTATTSMPKTYMIPMNSVKSFWINTWNSTQNVGKYYTLATGAGAMKRGGQHNDTTLSGIFATGLDSLPETGGSEVGFRCVLRGLTSETPKAFTAVASKDSVSLSWEKGGSMTTGYLLVRGQAGKLPLFQPAHGTSYSAGSQGNDSIIFVGNKLSKLDSGLTTGGNYHYRLFAYDAANKYSSAALQSVYVTRCAENWVFVPGDSDYKTSDFCVMKYEAKSDGATIPMPLAQAASTPWASITQHNSMTKCSALGMGYHLLSNAEWMTLGANAAAINGNWSGGAVGSGSLFAGHTDSNPNSACAASSNDSLFYVESTCTGVSSGDTAEQNRTLTLSNGNVIWDLSGNLWEWINYYNIADKPGNVHASLQYSSLSGTATTPLSYLVPTNAVKSYWTNSWNSTQRIGEFYPGTNGTGGGLRRGGEWRSGATAGLFAATVLDGPTMTDIGLGFRCIQSLPDLDDTTLTLTPSTTSINASWTSTGASGYLLVRGPADSEPSFIPSEGTSYSAGAQSADTILYVGTSLSYNDTPLTTASTYFYALYSYDADDSYRLLTRDYEMPVTCPTGFVLVPGDKDYATQDFCVMKYEAKNNGSGVAVSQAASTPWVSISQLDAKTKCTAMGQGYHLISNDEWMTIGANAAAINGNWTGGTVGSGYLVAGHNDSSPASSCAASSNDTLFYVETNCTAVSSGDSAEQRRTHTLSNATVIWDLAGNAWEWVNSYTVDDKPGAVVSWLEYTALTGTASIGLHQLIPTHAVKAFWVDTWNSGQTIGRMLPGDNGVGGGLRRGGPWDDGTNVGVFSAALTQSPTYTSSKVGFRCTLTAP